jgi:hypothetical protein
MYANYKQPMPKQLQRLIPLAAKTIEQYAAKGWGNPVSL